MRKDERGAAAALVICMLPLLIVVMALVIDVGVLVWYRFALINTADLAALAGVQELDLNALAQGEPRLIPEAARATVIDYARCNLQAKLGNQALQELEIQVDIYNGSPTDPVIHAGCGRQLIHPTICLRISMPVKLVFISKVLGQEQFVVRTHTDAAAVWRSS